MATLAANVKRKFEFNQDPMLNDYPMKAAEIVFEGAAVGLTSGIAEPLADATVFAGFATAKADNSAGAASAITVRVIQRGTVKLTLGGTVTAAKVDDVVYASDDATFSLTDTGTDVAIGRLSRFIDSTTGMVSFTAVPIRP